MGSALKYLVAVLAVAVALAGCSKQPEQEMNAAKAAVDAISAEGGAQYAPEETKALTDGYGQAMAEVKGQDGKLLKNFDKAKEMLAKVSTDAEALKAELAARKEAAKQAADEAMTAATASVENARALLAKAPTGKGTTEDIEALKSDVNGLEDSLPEVQALIEGGDYLAASEKANAIKTQADGVAEEITTAMAKVKKAAPAKPRKKA